jgi:hypothetical protein
VFVPSTGITFGLIARLWSWFRFGVIVRPYWPKYVGVKYVGFTVHGNCVPMPNCV